MTSAWHRDVEAALRDPGRWTAVEHIAQRLLVGAGYDVTPLGGSGDAAADFIAKERVGDRLVEHLGQVTCQKTWKAKKLPKWLEETLRVRPSHDKLLFLMTNRASGAAIKKLEEQENARTGRALRILDLDWFLLRLEEPANRLLAEELLGVSTRAVRAFVPVSERQSLGLARGTDGRRVAASFAGRAQEIARLSELIARHDVVLICGSGGVGKSRLAFESARDPGMQAALPGARWLYADPISDLDDRDLRELPGDGLVVVIIDDPQREPRSRALSALRRLQERPEWKGRIKLLLSTRAASREDVQRLVGAEPVATLALGPLSDASVDALLSDGPCRIAKEEARRWIVRRAQGSPLIAEALAVLHQTENGLPALKRGEVLARLLDGALDAAPTTPWAGRARQVIGVLAAFTEFPWSEEAARLNLAAALQVSPADLEAAVDWWRETGWVQDAGNSVAVRPDLFGEALLAREHFGTEGSADRFRRDVWDRLADVARAALLERFASATGLAEGAIQERMKEFLRTRTAEAIDACGTQGNLERLAALKGLATISVVLPDLAILGADRISKLDATSTTDLERAFGITERAILQECSATAARAMRHSPADAQGRGVKALLGFRQRMDDLAQGPDRILRNAADEALRECMPVSWKRVSTPRGDDIDVSAARARVAAVIEWMSEDCASRSRLACELLQIAVERRFVDPRLGGDGSLEGWTSNELIDGPAVRGHLATIWSGLHQAFSGSVAARHASVVAATAAWRGWRRNPLATRPNPDGALQVVEDAAFDLMGASEEHWSDLDTPTRAALFEWIAEMRAAGVTLRPPALRLFAWLVDDPDVRIFRALAGGLSRIGDRGEALAGDFANAWRTAQRTVIDELLARASENVEGVIDQLARLTAEGLSAAGTRLVHADMLASRLACERPELAGHLALQCAFRDPEGLGHVSVTALGRLWESDPTVADGVAQELVRSDRVVLHVICASSLRPPLPASAWTLATKLARHADPRVQLVLARAMSSFGEPSDERRADVLLTLGQECHESVLPLVLEALCPERAAERSDVPPIPEDRLDDLALVVARAMRVGAEPTHQVQWSFGLDWLATARPAGFVREVRLIIARGATSLPESVEHALENLPRGNLDRARLVEECLRDIRQGARAYIRERMLRSMLTQQEADDHARNIRDAFDDADWALAFALAPSMTTAGFLHVLARFTNAVPLAERQRLLQLTCAHVLDEACRFGSVVPPEPGVLRAWRLVEPWKLGDSASLAEFASWVEDRARQARTRDERAERW